MKPHAGGVGRGQRAAAAKTSADVISMWLRQCLPMSVACVTGDRTLFLVQHSKPHMALSRLSEVCCIIMCTKAMPWLMSACRCGKCSWHRLSAVWYMVVDAHCDCWQVMHVLELDMPPSGCLAPGASATLKVTFKPVVSRHNK